MFRHAPSAFIAFEVARAPSRLAYAFRMGVHLSPLGQGASMQCHLLGQTGKLQQVIRRICCSGYFDCRRSWKIGTEPDIDGEAGYSEEVIDFSDSQCKAAEFLPRSLYGSIQRASRNTLRGIGSQVARRSSTSVRINYEEMNTNRD